MAEINLKRFVDINIQPHISESINSTRNTVALFTYEGSSSDTPKVFNSMQDVINDGTFNSSSDTYKYLQVYFNNYGVSANVYCGMPYTSLTKDVVLNLSNDLIYIACVVQDDNIEACYSALKALAQSLDSDNTVYGINEKLILARTKATTGSASTINVDTDSVANFIVKFSSTIGAEMTIAAYFSQLDVYGTDTVKDYAFTEENITEEIVDDNLFGAIQTNNMNVDITLANSVRNCGGNCKDGQDAINNFTRIILHQTLTSRLINLLTEKIKDSSGVSKIYSVIAQELERYKTSGYLTTDKIWTDRTLYVNYNGATYTIINQGDALLNGYVIKVLPIVSLTEEDRQKHLAPPIYIVIADQYGIRQITITGQVI